MPLSGGGNKWTDHVRAFANSKGISYMCAMSDPACSATYKGVKQPKAVKPKKATKKEKRENITMSMEDKPAPARREALGDIFESTIPIEGFNSPTIRAVLKNKGSLNKALEKKLADQQGMLAEDINRALPDTKGKKAGRPRKYSDPETARQAKIANTIRRAKERVVEKKDTKMTARIDRAKKEYNRWLEQLEGNTHVDSQGNRIEETLIQERMDKMRKKYPSLKDSDWYRPAVLKQSTGKGFNNKTGGMLSWVKSVIGRHPRLTPEQIREAEKFASDLMADPRGITFEGASIIPLDVRKELAQELYNRQTMGREDKDAPPNPAEAFSDEIRKQYASQKKKGKGRMSGGFGFNDFIEGLNAINPVMWGIKNHPDVGIKLGKVTNNNLLPAVVTIGKPVYDATAIATATAFTGNPLLGKAVADAFWNEYGKPFDPRDRQDNEALKQISERLGSEAGKKTEEIGKGVCVPDPTGWSDCINPLSLAIQKNNKEQAGKGRGRPRKPRGGATALQKGLSAEMRSYTKPPLQHDLNQIIHSNDAPTSRYGATPNPYRDHSNQFDAKAQRQIDRAIAVLVNRGIVPSGALKPTSHVFVPTGAGSGQSRRNRVEPTMNIFGVEIPVSRIPPNLRTPPTIQYIRQLIVDGLPDDSEPPSMEQVRDVFSRALSDYNNRLIRFVSRLTPSTTTDSSISSSRANSSDSAGEVPDIFIDDNSVEGGGSDYGHLWESERRLNGGLGADPRTWSHSGLVRRPVEDEGAPIFTADWRGPEVQAERRRMTEDWRKAQGGLVRRPVEDEGAPIFTADWRGPEVQAERRRMTEDWRKAQGGGIPSPLEMWSRGRIKGTDMRGIPQGGSVLGDLGSVVNHLVSHITDPKEPIDPRDFAQAINLIKSIKKMKGGYSAEDFFSSMTHPRSGMGYHGGIDPREANTPDHDTAITPPVPVPVGADDDMEGIDWFAIGQALLNDAGVEGDRPNAPQP